MEWCSLSPPHFLIATKSPDHPSLGWPAPKSVHYFVPRLSQEDVNPSSNPWYKQDIFIQVQSCHPLDEMFPHHIVFLSWLSCCSGGPRRGARCLILLGISPAQAHNLLTQKLQYVWIHMLLPHRLSHTTGKKCDFFYPSTGSFLDQDLFWSINSVVFNMCLLLHNHLDTNTIKCLTSLKEIKSG